MAKFKQGDRIHMVEDKDYVVTVEKVTKNGYELNNRFKVYFKEESEWELETPSEPSTHEMKVTAQTEWHDIDTFCREHLKLDDGEVAKITITKE